MSENDFFSILRIMENSTKILFLEQLNEYIRYRRTICRICIHINVTWQRKWDLSRFLLLLPYLLKRILFKLEMAAHSTTLAWKIPWTEEVAASMGSRRVGHHRVTSLSLFTSIHWRRKWQPTPVFLPGEPQGRRSLVGCLLWGHTESDMTEAT